MLDLEGDRRGHGQERALLQGPEVLRQLPGVDRVVQDVLGHEGAGGHHAVQVEGLLVELHGL
eukprot:10041494-Alexandrium_andersonii.AAC.1